MSLSSKLYKVLENQGKGVYVVTCSGFEALLGIRKMSLMVCSELRFYSLLVNNMD